MGIGVSFSDRVGSGPARFSPGMGSEITTKSHAVYYYFGIRNNGADGYSSGIFPPL